MTINQDSRIRALRKIVLLVAVLFFYQLCDAQEKDTIYLHNGQILIGEIKNAQLGIITIDDKDLKLVSIKIYKIKFLQAGHTIFRIETHSKAIYYSTLLRSENPGEVYIQDVDKPLKIRLDEISLLASIEKGFFHSLDGNAGLGFSFTKSSKIGQLNMNAVVYYTAKRMQYQLNASAIYSIDSSQFSRDNESAQLFGSYSLTTSWFAAGQLTYQRNLEFALARRFQELLGAGNKLFIKQDWQLWALSGLSLGQEKSTLGSSNFTVELPIMLKFNFFRYERVNIQITATQTAYISLSPGGRIRYDGNLNYAQELIRNFNLNINFYSNFDSRPPEANSSNFDFGTTLSLNYKF